MGLLSSLTGGSKSSSASGFTTVPDYMKDFVQDDVFPMMKDYFSSGFAKQPMRRIDESDLDPTFGSKRRVAMQGYLDKLAEIKAQTPQAVESDAPDISDLFMKNPITGLTELKNQESGGKFSPTNYSLEDAQRLGQQGFSSPMSGIMGQLVKMLGKVK